MEPISWQDFKKIELRVGTIIREEPFPEARKPDYKVWVDFGETIGTKCSSVQITALYTPESLQQKQVICVLNFHQNASQDLNLKYSSQAFTARTEMWC